MIKDNHGIIDCWTYIYYNVSKYNMLINVLIVILCMIELK